MVNKPAGGEGEEQGFVGIYNSSFAKLLSIACNYTRLEETARELRLSGKAVEYHLTKALRHLRLRLVNLLA